MKNFILVSLSLLITSCATMRTSSPELTDEMFKRLTIDVEEGNLKAAKATLETAIQYDNGRGSFKYYHMGDVGKYELRDVDEKSKELLRYMVLANKCSKIADSSGTDRCITQGVLKLEAQNYSLGSNKSQYVEDVKRSICGESHREAIGYAQFRLPHVFIFRSEPGSQWSVVKKLRSSTFCKQRRSGV